MSFAQYLTYSGMGFSQLKNQPLEALASPDYERTFDNKEDWQTLQAQMNAYFDAKTDMFEYRLHHREDSGWRLHAFIDRLFFRIEHPSRYFELEGDIIRRRFPGGLGTSPGDEDLRSLVSALRHLFAHNLAKFILFKRAAALGFSLVAIAVFAFVVETRQPVSVFLAVNAALSVVFLGVNDWIILKYYLSALNESCLFVNNEASRRTKNLSNLFDALLPKIDIEREKLQFERRLHDWPERAARWMTLIYWVAKRLEYVERHVHIEIWRMRRIQYWLNCAGLAVTLVTLAVTLGLLWSVWLLLKIHADPLVWTEFAGVNVLVAGFALASYLLWNTPINLVEQKLQTDNWNRYSQIHVHTKISAQIFRDKQKIIDLDWTARGQGGPNSTLRHAS